MEDTGRARVEIVQPVEFGTAELVPDPHRPAAWTLLVDDVAQSYVDLDDPAHLEFEYTRRVATVIRAVRPSGRPLRTLHLGGGALTLARYVAVTRPGSPQRVVERDGVLVELVRRVLPLPYGADVDIHVGDARRVVEAEPDASYDLVIGDAFHAAQMVANLTTVEYTREVARVLRPDGLYALNVTDLPALAFSRVQAATLRHVFTDVCVLGQPGMLRGRRFGNVVLAATRSPAGLPLERLGPDAQRLHGDTLDKFVAGAVPATDPTES